MPRPDPEKCQPLYESRTRPSASADAPRPRRRPSTGKQGSRDRKAAGAGNRNTGSKCGVTAPHQRRTAPQPRRLDSADQQFDQPRLPKVIAQSRWPEWRRGQNIWKYFVIQTMSLSELRAVFVAAVWLQAPTG